MLGVGGYMVVWDISIFGILLMSTNTPDRFKESFTKFHCSLKHKVSFCSLGPRFSVPDRYTKQYIPHIVSKLGQRENRLAKLN